MATYEEQLRKWVLNKYSDLDPTEVTRVTVESDTIYGGYCNTCRYEEEGYEVKAYNEDNTLVFTDRSSRYTLAEILRQIIEAK